MNSKEKKNYVDLIAYGFKAMEDRQYVSSPIYGFMARFLVTPKGTKIATKGIEVRRQIKDGSRYFRINYNKQRPLLLPANMPSEIEAAIVWMENNNCLPRIKAFKTVIIPVQFIKV